MAFYNVLNSILQRSAQCRYDKAESEGLDRSWHLQPLTVSACSCVHTVLQFIHLQRRNVFWTAET